MSETIKLKPNNIISKGAPVSATVLYENGGAAAVTLPKWTLIGIAPEDATMVATRFEPLSEEYSQVVGILSEEVTVGPGDTAKICIFVQGSFKYDAIFDQQDGVARDVISKPGVYGGTTRIPGLQLCNIILEQSN